MTASLNSARAKARDAKRLADLKEISTALKMYELDHGYLPNPASYGENNPNGDWDYSSKDTDNDGIYFLDFLVDEGYMKTVPVDPINDGTGDVWYSGSSIAHDGEGYSYGYYCYLPEDMTLGATIENKDYVRKYFPDKTFGYNAHSGVNVLYISNHDNNFKCK